MPQLRSLRSSPLFVSGSLFRLFRGTKRQNKLLVVNKRPHCSRMKRTGKGFTCRLLLRVWRNTALPLPSVPPHKLLKEMKDPFSPSSFTKTICNPSLVERLDPLPMVVLLTLEGNCSCRRAKPAHFGCHLPLKPFRQQAKASIEPT